MKLDHAGARTRAAVWQSADNASTGVKNLAACYLDLTERHAKLLELAEQVLGRIDLVGGLGEYKGGAPFCIPELRAFIEGERNGL